MLLFGFPELRSPEIAGDEESTYDEIGVNVPGAPEFSKPEWQHIHQLSNEA